METPVLVLSLKSSILSSTSAPLDKTFLGVVSAAVEQSRGKAKMVALGDGQCNCTEILSDILGKNIRREGNFMWYKEAAGQILRLLNWRKISSGSNNNIYVFGYAYFLNPKETTLERADF